MTALPDFQIMPTGTISKTCLEHNLSTFHRLVDFTWHLPYGRNTDKNNLATVFTDGCGTCGTKHALLKQVADEQGVENISLVIGLFRMNGRNTPSVEKRLAQYGIAFIPEAHCYLKFDGRRFDFTKAGPGAFDFEPDLIEEAEILPHQITGYKVNYQKTYLKNWLNLAPIEGMDLEALWAVREQCIRDLSEA